MAAFPAPTTITLNSGNLALLACSPGTLDGTADAAPHYIRFAGWPV
jgi:hypothetical protein